MAAHNIAFTHVPLWVQVWGLPFDLMTEETARDIGSVLGTVLMVDSKPFESDQARFLRIRISIPLNQPLRRGSPITNPEGDRFVVAFKYERSVGLCYACGHLGHERKNYTLHDPNPEQQPNLYGEWMKAGARRRGDPADNKTTSPPHRRDDSASEPEPTRQPAQSQGSAVVSATVTSQVTSPTLELVYPQVTLPTSEPVHPLGKVNLTAKQDRMENMVTKKYEVPTKSTSTIPEPVPTTPQLCMKPPATHQVSEHLTDPLPITEAPTDMHGGEGSMSCEHAGHVGTKPQFLKNHVTHVEGSIISEHASHVVSKPHSQTKQTTWTRLARGPDLHGDRIGKSWNMKVRR